MDDFLGLALAVTLAFLAARFYSASPSTIPPLYWGGSFPQVLFIQPRLWVFMMGKMLIPMQFSADYTLENAAGISTSFALMGLVIVVACQVWLAAKAESALSERLSIGSHLCLFPISFLSLRL